MFFLFPKNIHKKIVNYYNLFIYKYVNKYSKKSYAMEGEDVFLDFLFGENKRKGFYIDVGAHHPKKISNTYFFYKKG